jgi:two-component system, NarL family, nitrate/nitrite response regulator NarL
MVSLQHPDWDPIRVLVLTDLDLGLHTRQRLTEARSEGLWLVGTASSRDAAVDLLANTGPQVIVIDIDGEFGPDTIADFAERCDARLLALTGSGDTEVQDGAVLAGACGVVQKREAADILVDAIRCVYEGEMWINHAAADRILDELAHAREAAKQQERIRATLARLTLKERVIAAEITRGHSATPREIAARLQISESRLQDYLASIYRKLELDRGEMRVSGARPEPFTRQLNAVRADPAEPSCKPVPLDSPKANAVTRFSSGPTTHADRSPPGCRGEDPIVVSSGAVYPHAVPASRWRQLRRLQ